MDDNVKAGCLGCFVVALIYSAASFVALIALASGDADTGDAGSWIGALIGPGVIAFIPLALFGVVMLVAWFFTSRE